MNPELQRRGGQEEESGNTLRAQRGRDSAFGEHLLQDFRYGLRILKKNPMYAFVSVLTLALGIGASTAIFSVVYGVLLRALPYNKPEQIVCVWELGSKGERMPFADPNFEDIRNQAHSLQGIAEMRSEEVPVSVDDEPDRIRVATVSSDFFSVMGVQPVKGRLFLPEEQHVGSAPVALVSYAYWQRHLHETPVFAQVKFTLSKKSVAIIGVLPPEFSFPDNSQVWLARETDASLPSRSAHNWQAVARLRDGMPLNRARVEVSEIAGQIYKQYGPHDIDMVDAALQLLRDALTASVKPALLVLFGVAGLLLLVACANVMNLSLAQASARAGELAIRAALGASRWRLVRQFLTEVFLLCLLGGSLGILVAYFGIRALLAYAPSNIPRLNEVSVNLPVLWFALGLSVAVAGGLGIYTALRSTSREVQNALSEGGNRQGKAVGSRRTGSVIVAAQVAITMTLLVGAGLLARSMLRVLSIHPGFETEHVLSMDLQLPEMEAGAERQRVQLFDQLISRLRALPGIQMVGGTDTLPLKDETGNGAFAIVNPQQLSPAQRALIDRSAHIYIGSSDPGFMNDLSRFLKELFRDKAHTGYADYVVASKGYFQTLGIPLLQGRLFNDEDGPDAPQVAVISESVARQKWPNQSPLGQSIEFGNMDGDLRLLTIIGVVGEVRTRNLETAPPPIIYVNYRQRARTISEFNIVMRTSSDPAAVFTSARAILRQLDSTLPPRFNTFEQIFSESLSSRRFNLVLVGVFAIAALMLAMAGVFGVLAYSVAERTREIGVRIALGATANNIQKMVLKQGLTTALIGIGIGLAGAFVLTRTMRSLLFAISPTDLVTFAGVALLLMIVVTLASYIPARRATLVEPTVALRHD
jgi:putative ABC transport system permease protein